MNRCPLCQSKSKPFYAVQGREFFSCTNCQAVFLNPAHYISSTAEKERYLTHNNDIYDPGYQQFVSPITDTILSNFTREDTGLDFGSGTGPVISKIVRDHEYNIKTFDPFFDNNPQLLKNNYNYIACCEVIEHFHKPYKEFSLLHSLLLPKGKLICMTELYYEHINFDKWYYKNDPTHVIFYHKNSLKYIKQQFGFSTLEIDGRLLIFTK